MNAMTPPRRLTEGQIREGLDGTFVVHHFSGKFIKIAVPHDFNPYTPQGQGLVNAAGWQKVIET